MNNELMTTMDLLPTFAKLAGGEVPGDRVIDGKDIWPVLTGKSKSPHEAFFYYGGNTLCAVRSGEWKLHVAARKGPLKQPVLFNLKDDIGEKENVADKHPDVVRRLKGYVEAFEKELVGHSRPAAFVENPKPLIPHIQKENQDD